MNDIIQFYKSLPRRGVKQPTSTLVIEKDPSGGKSRIYRKKIEKPIMTDQLISFETSNLANQKGFDRDVQDFIIIPDTGDTYLPGVTQSLLQRWLREIHNLHIEIESHSIGVWYHNIQRLGGSYGYFIHDFVGYDTYEDALEAALKKALTMI